MREIDLHRNKRKKRQHEEMYDLHHLGWHNFQQLCLTITREILGQTVESFLDTADAGQDGAFSGTWQINKTESLEGRFVIQCKFTSKPGKNLVSSDLTAEVEKVRRLVQNGRCDSYVLMTNAGLSGSSAGPIKDLFTQAGVKHVATYGSTWICHQISENKRLRMLVPRLYGLGDLSQIMDDRAYTQAKALLASLSDDLSKVVLTGAYRKAAEAMDRHGFVLLVGEPAAGKTTIASMLSMVAMDRWGASILKLDNAERLVDRWNPDEPSQFFWIDDAFGVMQCESSLVNGWAHQLPMIKTMIGRGAKIIMTSRDYIYKRARKKLKEESFPLLQESQVVIDVHDLTAEEKQQILYNHIKLGKQPKTFRSAIKPHLPLIAAHPRFVPETARRLGDPTFTQWLTIDHYSLEEFVEKQEHLLQEVIRGLDEHSQAALALIYMRNNSLESPVELEASEREAIERLGSNSAACYKPFDELNGSLVQYVQEGATAFWRFKHPTVGDAYAKLLLQSPESLRIYVHGCSIGKLTTQVTCGDVGFEKAVSLPKALFPLVIKRLDEFSATTPKRWDVFYNVSRRIDDFLSSRCSKEFLRQYVEKHPDILDRISSPGRFLNAVSEVDLAFRLHEFGILPEACRKEFVKTVVDYALNGEDFGALVDRRIQSIFTSNELSKFKQRVRAALLPNLDNVRCDWELWHNHSEDPDQHMEPLREGLSALKEEFAYDEAIIRKINEQLKCIEEWIAENSESKPEIDRPDRTLGKTEAPVTLTATDRSIFDDVDA